MTQEEKDALIQEIEELKDKRKKQQNNELND